MSGAPPARTRRVRVLTTPARVALVGVCVVVVVVGAVLAADHGTSTAGRTSTAGPAAPTTLPSAPVPTAAQLRVELLQPSDFGGYYRVDAGQVGSVLHGSTCLSALDGPGAPAASAATFMSVANPGDLPALLEMVDAYATPAKALAAFRHDTADLAGCRSLSTNLGARGQMDTTLAPEPLSALDLQATGDAVAVYRGTYTLAGLAQSVQLAVVAGRDDVVLVVQLDRNPPLAGSAVYDDFGSAVTTAYGKLA